MPAMGHKQTYAVQKGMCALPSKADIQQTADIEKLFDRLVDAIEKFVTGDVG